MASSTIRKAIRAMKDQTSISIAKVAGTIAPDLEVLVVKATTHDDEPTDEKYIRDIISITFHSRVYVPACVAMISKRLGKTRDWIVALKALMLVHRLLVEGDHVFKQEVVYGPRRGTRLLDMSGFRDEAHSNSWDHSAFVRTYAVYLDEKLMFLEIEKKFIGRGSDEKKSDDNRVETRKDEYGYGGSRDEFNYGMPRRSRSYGHVNEAGAGEQRREVTPVREMKPEKVLDRLKHLLRLLDLFLACRPTGAAKNSRMVLVALYLVVRESFELYGDMRDALEVLLDRFSEMEYPDCVQAFDAYVSAAKHIDELVGFYNWCKDTGVARSSEFPQVQRVTNKIIETLEGLLKDRANRPKSPERKKEENPPAVIEEREADMNAIETLPPPENYVPTPPTPPETEPKLRPQQETKDLVNLRDDGISAEDQDNKLALALFSGPPVANTNGLWEAFPTNGEPGVTSAWQNPAAERGKADWELALVESSSNLSKQAASLGGGLDPLSLNGMYDQGTVKQHVSSAQLSSGSASSVALPGPPGKSSIPMLALPAPDGTVQAVGQDPFAASLAVPPPAYVQVVDMEKKQQLLLQEQQLWQQYGSNGMQGQAALANISSASYYRTGPQPIMPYGMPQVRGMGQPGGYYYTPY